MPVFKFIIINFIFFIFFSTPVRSAENGLYDVKRLIEQNRFSQAETLLRKKIKIKSSSLDLHFQLARILAWQKKYNASLTEYDWLLKKSPGNSDYRLGKARTLQWAGKNQLAVNLLETTRSATPEYEDVWRLLISILQKSKNKADQTKAKELLTQAKKRFPDAQWHKHVIKKKKPLDTSYTDVELGFNFDTLGNNYDNWSSVYLLGEHRYQNSSKVYMTATQTERFKLTDEEFLLGYFTPINPDWNMIVEASLSPSHKVRPKWSAFAQAQRQYNHGWNGYLGLRKTEYNETNTQALSFSVERYWQNFRFAYTGYATQVNGAAITAQTFITHVIASDFYYAEKNQLGFALTSGEELEYNGSANPPISDIKAIVFKGRHWFSPKWAINYDINFHQQGTIYSRHGYRFSLRYRY